MLLFDSSAPAPVPVKTRIVSSSLNPAYQLPFPTPKKFALSDAPKSLTALLFNQRLKVNGVSLADYKDGPDR